MDDELGIDRVISRTIEILQRNFLAFALLALPLVLAPKVAGIFSISQPLAFRSYFLDPMNFGLLGLAATLFGLLFSATLIRASLNQAVGDPADVPDSLTSALRLFLPILGLSILQWLAIGFGLVLLIVPGVILFCMFSVALPAMIAERQGVMAALQRSQALTSGHRWKIFGIFLLFWIVTAVAGGIATSLFGVFLPSPDGALSGALRLFQGLVETAAEIVEPPLVAALYVELRTAKEGGMHESLSRIFE